MNILFLTLLYFTLLHYTLLYFTVVYITIVVEKLSGVEEYQNIKTGLSVTL